MPNILHFSKHSIVLDSLIYWKLIEEGLELVLFRVQRAKCAYSLTLAMKTNVASRAFYKVRASVPKSAVTLSDVIWTLKKHLLNSVLRVGFALSADWRGRIQKAMFPYGVCAITVQRLDHLEQKHAQWNKENKLNLLQVYYLCTFLKHKHVKQSHTKAWNQSLISSHFASNNFHDHWKWSQLMDLEAFWRVCLWFWLLFQPSSLEAKHKQTRDDSGRLHLCNRWHIYSFQWIPVIYMRMCPCPPAAERVAK